MGVENFPYYRDQLFDLYNARKYREALAVAFRAKEKFPERKAKNLLLDRLSPIQAWRDGKRA